MTLNDVLNAVIRHPYPIEWRTIDYSQRKKPSPFISEVEMEKYSPLPIITVDVRLVARKALEDNVRKEKEEYDRYWKLYNEFEDFKKEHQEFVKFKRWMREGN